MVRAARAEVMGQGMDGEMIASPARGAMNTETEVDIRWRLRRAADYNDNVIESCIAYFNRFPEHEEWFTKELADLCWRNKFVGAYRNHISLTAVPLANKIYEQLGIIAFPFIQRVACRGWDTSGGTWAWSMDTTTGQDIGSTDPVRYLLKKRVKLFQLDGPNSNGEIGGQERNSQSRETVKGER